MKKKVKRIASFLARTSKSILSFLNAKIHCSIKQISCTNAVDTLDDLVYDKLDGLSSYGVTLASVSSTIALPWDSGAFASVVSDLMGAFGGVFGKSLNSATTAIEFGNYVEGRRKEIIADPDATQEEIDAALARMFPFAYKDKSGAIKSVEVSGADIVHSGEFINKLKNTAADTFEVPVAFVRTFQNFLVDKLNFSAIDDTLPITVIYMPALDWFNCQHSLPLSGYSKDKTLHFYSSSRIWCDSIPLSTRSRHFYALPGTTAYYYNSNSGELRSYTFTEPFSNGICFSSLEDVWSSVNSYLFEAFGLTAEHSGTMSFPKGCSYKSVTFPVSYTYATPSVDVSFADAKAITWTGSADLATTLENQKAAEEAGTLEDYIAKAITTNKYPETSDDPVTDIGEIANRYGFRDIGDKGYGKCEKAAKEMKAYLEKNKLHGSVITLMWSPRSSGHIWSDYASKSIGDNGLHVGILYEGKVYCNVHPYGLPKQQWIDDFNCPYPAIKLPAIEVPF